MSRYWPSMTSVRMRPNSSRAAAAASRSTVARPLLEEAVAPAEQQVAEQQRGRRAVAGRRAGPAAVAVQALEPPVQARLAAAQVGVVHDVVVHERGGVEELEGRRDRHDAVERGGGVGRRIEVVALRGDRLPAPVAEQRAEPLSAREERSRGRVDDVEVGGDLVAARPRRSVRYESSRSWMRSTNRVLPATRSSLARAAGLQC